MNVGRRSVELVRLHPQQGLARRDQSLLHHLEGNADSRRTGCAAERHCNMYSRPFSMVNSMSITSR